MRIKNIYFDMGKLINDYLSSKVNDVISNKIRYEDIYEIRLRVDKPLIIYTKSGENVFEQCIVYEEDIADIFNKITEYSAYAHEYSIKNGYLTIRGGHRVGFGGEVVYENNQIKGMKNIRFLNIRISHFIEGCAEGLAKILKKENGIWNTLIISPPGLGKTTLLRDLIRCFSANIPGTSICVIDERNEISGSYMGVPTIELGIRTDVICNCEKEKGIMMAIRSLAPKIIAVDEIGSRQDEEALYYAVKSGVSILATIHGEGIDDVRKKTGQAYGNIFQKYIVIKEKGEYECL